MQVVFVFCGLISASGSVKISENDGSGMQQSPGTGHTQMDKLEKSEQMSKLVSKVIYSHADDSTIDGSDVTISKFSTNTFGGDVGFAYNQDF